MVYTLPDSLRRRVAGGLGTEGIAWLQGLPQALEEQALAWDLRLQPPFPGLSYNYVCPARSTNGRNVVLKLSAPWPDRDFEPAALTHFEGAGSVRLLRHDPAAGALLLERVDPGTPLPAIAGDDDLIAATRILGSAMLRLRGPAPASSALPNFAGWLDTLGRASAQGKAAGIPAGLREEAFESAASLAAAAPQDLLLHGDLNPGNLLWSSKHGWTAIDPKGVIGDAAFEWGPFFLNMSLPTDDGEAVCLLLRLAGAAAAASALPQARILRATLVFAVLSTFWTLEEEGHTPAGGIRLAQLLRSAVQASG